MVSSLIPTNAFFRICAFVGISTFSPQHGDKNCYPYNRPVPVQAGERSVETQMTFIKILLTALAELRSCGGPHQAASLGKAKGELNIPVLSTLLFVWGARQYKQWCATHLHSNALQLIRTVLLC